jgi:hypothetical protein
LLTEVVLPFLQTGIIAACFHGVGKYCGDKLRLKICLRIGTNISEQPLIINPGMSSTSADLDGLSRLTALTMSESERDAKGKDSEDDKMVGKTLGQALLYTDWKCFENSSATS